MKYGETLRQLSIPAWSHHNIDYDEIKLLIKDHTTPGRGKTVSIPGRGDDLLAVFERELFDVFADQHHRIDLFVRSKAGEIQRRLDHSKKQIRQLAARQANSADNRIPVARLERYGRIENDVLKAGEEIKSLARFTSTQRTAIRKLLKKYRKWTGSKALEDRFHDEVLADPKSFTKADLGPLLDDYSATKQSIRNLYEAQVQRSNAVGGRRASGVANSQDSASQQLQDAIAGGSKVQFDTAIATVPLGEVGAFASYFVHPESFVELQVLLLQHAKFHSSRSRSNSIATPVSVSRRSSDSRGPRSAGPDYHFIAADSLERFVQEQSSLTINHHENTVGSRAQRAKVSVRWNNEEEAMACVRLASGIRKACPLKKKRVLAFLDRDATFSSKTETPASPGQDDLQILRQDLVKDVDVEPLFEFSSCRSRFVSTDDHSRSLEVATLDTNISIGKVGKSSGSEEPSEFPFGLLLVRQEGVPQAPLISVLDASHLVLKPNNIPSPFWLSILSRDIRKLPPPAFKRSGPVSDAESGMRSAGSRSSNGMTEGTTAVDTNLESVLEEPPLRSFRRKKKRLAYDMPPASQKPPRYWSEYDHPEDLDDGDDPNAYVIYIDPNERSVFDGFFDRMGHLFSRHDASIDEERLPSSPADNGTSSDDEDSALLPRSERRSKRTPDKRLASFGTFQVNLGAGSYPPPTRHASLSHFTAICYTASIVILGVAYLLAFTGRRRYVREVDVGVLSSVICSLVFAVTGFTSVLRSTAHVGVWAASIVVLLVAVVGSGGLLVYMFG